MFLAQTDVANVGLTLDPRMAKDLARAWVLIKLAALGQVRVSHPLNSDVAASPWSCCTPATGNRVPSLGTRSR